MSKSSGNVVLLSDLINKEIDPLALRLCFLENRYRSQMDLTWDALKTADQTLKKWREKFADNSGEIDLEVVALEVAQMAMDMNLDLDSPRALQKFRAMERNQNISAASKRAIALKIDEIFGLEFAKHVAKKEPSQRALELLEMRSTARESKDFKASDELRDELHKIGIAVRDTPNGQEWDWI